jgi:hypothetical protein
MGERDGVARANPKTAATSQLVDRPRDDPEANAVELAEERSDLAGQRAVHERLEEDRFGSVLTFVHRDEFGEDGIRALTARTPTLDASDQTLRPPTQRRIDETFFCRRVQVDRARGDVRAARDFAHTQLGVTTSRDLAQRG